MKELPFIEEIYDFETEQLESLLQEIDQMLLQGANGNQSQVELPKGFESFDKFERKALKLKESLELELEERRQVDDVISFFVNQTDSGGGNMFGNNNLLNDDEFYKPMSNPITSTTNTNINNNQLDSVMQRHNQSQMQSQLNQQNLNKLPSQQQLAQANNNNGVNLNTTRDDKLETDTNFSQYMKQSTDDTQSLYTAPNNKQHDEDSEMSKRMYVNRGGVGGMGSNNNNANKNKKDIGAFMREKLAKTKIASESMGVIQQSIAINPNNFAKKKKLDTDDSKSVISSSHNASEKQTIYKPNLKRKQSTTTSATKPNITSTTKISSNMVSGTVQGTSTATNANRKSSTSRGGGGQQSSVTRKTVNKDDSSSQPLIKKQQTSKPPAQSSKQSTTTSVQDKQNTTATSSIYKPSNMSSTTVSMSKDNNTASGTGKSRGSSNRPPIPSTTTSKSSKQPSQTATSDQNKHQKDKNARNKTTNSNDNGVDDNQDQLNTWDAENKLSSNLIGDVDDAENNDQQLLGQEEIESKYDDNDDAVDAMSQYSHQQHPGQFNQQIKNNNNINNYMNNVDEDELQQQQQDVEEEDGNGDVDDSSEDKKFKVSDLLNKVEVSNPQRQQLQQNNKDNNDSDDEEEKINDQNDDNDDENEEDQDFYKPISDSDIKPKLRKDSTTFQSDQDKLKKIFDYDEQQNALEDVSQSQQLSNNQKLIDTSSNNQLRVQQLNIQTEPSSTTSKKIRGKVQIFVDESALNSVQQTPKTTIPQQQQQQQQNDMISTQLKMLEEQDKLLDDPNTNIPESMSSNSKNNVVNANKQTNKRMEQLKQLMNQGDDQQRKQEQEDRMKQIRDQIQKDKDQKSKQDQQQQQQNTQSLQDDKITKTTEEVKQTTEETKSKTTKTTTTGTSSKTAATTKKQQQQSNKKDEKQQVSKIPRQPDGHDQYIDYSGHYKTFYEIFVGQLLDPKNFDVQFVIRDTRNTYAAFVNIMDSSAINLKRKFQFEQAPLEKSLQDYYKALPDFFSLTGKNINELEQEMKNRGNQIMMMQAMAQQQLKNNFQQLKSKDVNDIVKEAHEKAAQSAAGQVNGKPSQQNQLIEENRESSLYYRVVKNRTEVYDIISRAFSRKSKWNELPHGLDLKNTWNLMWTWSKIKIDITKLIVWQKCNHFNGAKNVSRKDFLKRNIERAQKMSAKAGQVFNMLPLTFILPKEYVGFLESFSEFEDKEGQLNYWIMKPAAKSRGRGISLVNDLTQITYGEPIVVQRYIKNPLLINGYKFDMRIYVVVTSVNPLEVFLYREGFGRFSTMPFSLDPTDRANKYIHLTNVSIQKYNVNNSDQDPNDLLYGGTKISIQTLKKRVQQAVNVNWDDQIWPQIRDVVLKSMVACQNDIQFNPSCFELFGFDILIDSDMKCWLIEINSSPSLARETLLDDMIKQKLIDDIVDLVDPVDFDRKRLFEVLERRINEDFKSSTTSNAYSKKLMNRDLTYILNGQVPRKYGEMPKQMGNFERIAPSPQSDAYLKLIGGQKMFGSMMKMQGEGDKPK